MKSLEVNLHTEDNIEIAGTYTPGNLPFGVIFLHQMPSTKESYANLTEIFSQQGFHTLAIDFRGHGKSMGGDYRQFSDEQHQMYIKDVSVAREYLLKQYPDMRLGIVGSSIGANIALQFAAENFVEFVVAVSGGLDYYGVRAEEFVQRLDQTLPVYFISAEDDGRTQKNSDMALKLYNLCTSSKKELKIFETGGHGTEIFYAHPDFSCDLVEWAKHLIQKAI